jgi:hypothetical protein
MTKAIDNLQQLGHTPVSYSSLKQFRKGGIHEYYRYKERELEPVSTNATDLGTLIDLYLLDKEAFEEGYILDTTSPPSSPNQLQFSQLVAEGACEIDEAYRLSYKNPPKTKKKLVEKAQEIYEANKEYIEMLPKVGEKLRYSENDSFALSQIMMNIQGHKWLRDYFPLENFDQRGDSFIGEGIEILTHQHLEGIFQGLPIHGEIDLAIINHDKKVIDIIDVKSTSYYLQNFGWQVKSQDYVMQAVIYVYLANQNLMKGGYQLNYPKLMPVRTQGDFGVGVFEIPKEWYKQELDKLKQDFKQLKWHYENRKFKYSQEYYEGDGILQLNYIKDMDLWKEEIEQSLL